MIIESSLPQRAYVKLLLKCSSRPNQNGSMHSRGKLCQDSALLGKLHACSDSGSVDTQSKSSCCRIVEYFLQELSFRAFSSKSLVRHSHAQALHILHPARCSSASSAQRKLPNAHLQLVVTDVSLSFCEVHTAQLLGRDAS